MYSLNEKDAKILNRVAKAENENLKVAIDDYANEVHFIGVIEGMIFLGVDIIGSWIAYKAACHMSKKFCHFGENAIGKFLKKNS